LTPEQIAWINFQKAERGFATASDVVRDMIREKQEERWRRLEKEFEEMSKRDGAPGPEPVDEIVAVCRQVKRKLLKQKTGFGRGSGVSAEKGISGAVPAIGNEPGRSILPIVSAAPVRAPGIVLFLTFLA